MNKVILMGRLVRDPEIRQAGDKSVASFTLAVDRRVARNDGQNTADFISCKAWEKKAEFIEKYCHKGTKLVITGRIQTGSYTDKDGKTVYTTEVVVEDQEFAESKSNSSNSSSSDSNGFTNIPEGFDEELPFA